MQTEQLSKHYDSDQPVSDNHEDRFQRYNFAARIAQTIISTSSSDALVIGIYGSWGEGKTSVLNFIEKELDKDPDQITVKFNPWRFSEEQALMLQFFNSLAKSVDAKLKNGKEVFGTYLKKFSKLVSFNIPVVGNLSGGIDAIGSLLDSADLEKQKKVVNEALLKANKRVIVIIDDIDRLDKTEIQAIFRLVKLNADFANTTYILSFDEKMVAAAIGERFGGGGEAAGRNFLEKIIQVPLRLPMIRTELIQAFCLKQIESYLSRNGIVLDGHDNERFGRVFAAAILPKLITPRIATRYSNTLSFSIPLLKGEVSVVELMMIEALKIFYPTCYNVVRYNPEIFLGMRMEREGEQKNIQLIEEKLLVEDSAIDRKYARAIIDELFPEARNEIWVTGSAEIYYNYQSVASPSYFERYFTYAVIEGDLSDASVKAFVSDKRSPERTETELNNFLMHNPAGKLLKKLRVASMSGTDEDKKSLGIILAMHIKSFPDEKEGEFDIHTPYSECVALVQELISRMPKELLDDAVKSIFSVAGNIEFVMDVISLMKKENSGPFSTVNVSGNPVFYHTLIDKALSISGEYSIFKVFPNYVREFLNIWLSIDEEGLTEYINKVFSVDGDTYSYILAAYAPIGSSGKPKDLDENRYQAMRGVVDVGLIAKQILKKYSSKELSSPVHWKVFVKDADREAMVLRLSLQFMSYFDGSRSNTV